MDNEFKYNPNHNYYICAVVRPNCQLFVVRLEWEAFADSETETETETETDTANSDDEKEDENFSLAMVEFQGMKFIMIGLERNVHDKVKDIAEDLDLVISPGYPLIKKTENSNEHFPISGCAADSVFTILNRTDVTDNNYLNYLKQQEKIKIDDYLATRWLESEKNIKKNINNAGTDTEDNNDYEIKIV